MGLTVQYGVNYILVLDQAVDTKIQDNMINIEAKKTNQPEKERRPKVEKALSWRK